jgi:hypothetical protein
MRVSRAFRWFHSTHCAGDRRGESAETGTQTRSPTPHTHTHTHTHHHHHHHHTHTLAREKSARIGCISSFKRTLSARQACRMIIGRRLDTFVWILCRPAGPILPRISDGNRDCGNRSLMRDQGGIPGLMSRCITLLVCRKSTAHKSLCAICRNTDHTKGK